MDDVEVVAVFSRRIDRARALAKTLGARAVSDLDAILTDPNIDAVDVCLPSANHPEAVIPALQAGKHVFCETPFALRMTDGQAMLDAAKAAKRILLVGLLMRSAAHYQHIHAQVESGQCGDLRSIVAYRLGSYLRPGGQDHKDHYSEPSLELMTFDFDFINWLIGPPIAVSATAVDLDDGTPGEISALLDYGNRRSATVIASGNMPLSFPFSAGFRVAFERGMFQLDMAFGAGPPKISFQFFPADGNPTPVTIPGHDPFEKELRHFIDCIHGKADPELLDGHRALEALQLSIATQQSLHEHRSINLSSLSLNSPEKPVSSRST